MMHGEILPLQWLHTFCNIPVNQPVLFLIPIKVLYVIRISKEDMCLLADSYCSFRGKNCDMQLPTTHVNIFSIKHRNSHY